MQARKKQNGVKKNVKKERKKTNRRKAEEKEKKGIWTLLLFWLIRPCCVVYFLRTPSELYWSQSICLLVYLFVCFLLCVLRTDGRMVLGWLKVSARWYTVFCSWVCVTWGRSCSFISDSPHHANERNSLTLGDFVSFFALRFLSEVITHRKIWLWHAISDITGQSHAPKQQLLKAEACLVIFFDLWAFYCVRMLKSLFHTLSSALYNVSWFGISQGKQCSDWLQNIDSYMFSPSMTSWWCSHAHQLHHY